MIKQILLIEDDPILLQTLVTYLESEKFLVKAASDGIQGLEMAFREITDVIVLDHDLPSMNGLEICRRLRLSGRTTPIIMLTGTKKEEIDRVLGLELGADDYLLKPIGLRELLARINAVLRRADSGSAPRPTLSPQDSDCPSCRKPISPGKRFCEHCGASLTAPARFSRLEAQTLLVQPQKLSRGIVFSGRYQIQADLGEGGMGSVYRALDVKLNEEVALKILHPEIAGDASLVERFRNEVRLARKISHKNVCRLFDLQEDDGILYIAMEYLAGENLHSLIRRMGSLPVDQAISITGQVAEGLVEAHRLGVIHRDLKPKNIMIDHDGNAKIMDFGIARSQRGDRITQTGTVMGTPEYMAPEQLEGEVVDGRADLYALGIVLYEMLTGHVPFEGNTFLIVALKHKTESPRNPQEINPQIPEALCRLILKCLEKDRTARFPDAGEVLRLLRQM
jgi:DNA-binding response OmpR family regulator/Holliday junction resolvase